MFSLYAKTYEDKERLVTALTNNDYVVGAELEKDNIHRVLGWRVDVYSRILRVNKLNE